MNRAIKALLAAGIVVAVVTVGSLVYYHYQTGTGVKTISINGTEYQVLNVTLTNNAASIRFNNVVFNIRYPCDLNLSGPPLNDSLSCANVTYVRFACTVLGSGGFCTGSLPQVQVIFPDGTTECFSRATVAQGWITYDGQKTASHIYFKALANPTVGIEWVAGAPPPDQLLLFVSD